MTTIDPMIRHADARGAVNTPAGIATLIGWPRAGARCLIMRDYRYARPLKTVVVRICCRICHEPADAQAAAAGARLCRNCALDLTAEAAS